MLQLYHIQARNGVKLRKNIHEIPRDVRQARKPRSTKKAKSQGESCQLKVQTATSERPPEQTSMVFSPERSSTSRNNTVLAESGACDATALPLTLSVTGPQLEKARTFTLAEPTCFIRFPTRCRTGSLVQFAL